MQSNEYYQAIYETERERVTARLKVIIEYYSKKVHPDYLEARKKDFIRYLIWYRNNIYHSNNYQGFVYHTFYQKYHLRQGLKLNHVWKQINTFNKILINKKDELTDMKYFREQQCPGENKMVISIQMNQLKGIMQIPIIFYNTKFHGFSIQENKFEDYLKYFAKVDASIYFLSILESDENLHNILKLQKKNNEDIWLVPKKEFSKFINFLCELPSVEDPYLKEGGNLDFLSKRGIKTKLKKVSIKLNIDSKKNTKAIIFYMFYKFYAKNAKNLGTKDIIAKYLRNTFTNFSDTSIDTLLDRIRDDKPGKLPYEIIDIYI